MYCGNAISLKVFGKTISIGTWTMRYLIVPLCYCIIVMPHLFYSMPSHWCFMDVFQGTAVDTQCWVWVVEAWRLWVTLCPIHRTPCVSGRSACPPDKRSVCTSQTLISIKTTVRCLTFDCIKASDLDDQKSVRKSWQYFCDYLGCHSEFRDVERCFQQAQSSVSTSHQY